MYTVKSDGDYLCIRISLIDGSIWTHAYTRAKCRTSKMYCIFKSAVMPSLSQDCILACI